ncbi:MAG: branched-chain amino acid ABC transporter substrate-binding protein [Candidatus Eremiobacteraeota bacterium]|nr:branched-chain amino acid ABC transporter substrate-binding protein [Candidatus Eremiobacteraeota bacterium]
MSNGRPSRRRFLLGSAAAVSAVATRPAFGAPFSQQLTIAVVVPLTGPQSAAGLQIVNGVRQAVDEVNRMTGALDRGFAMRSFDDQNSNVGAVMGAQFAASDPTAIATVGHLSGAVTMTALPQYANARMPLIVPASSADLITGRGYRNVFRLPTKDSVEGQLFARYVLPKVRPTRAVALTTDADYGPDVARGFVGEASLEKVSTTTIAVKADNPNLGDAAKRVQSFAPDYIFLAGNVQTLGPIVPLLRTFGFKGGFGAPQGFYTRATLQYSSEMSGAFISTSMPPLDRVTSAFQYVGDLGARYGEITPLIAFGFAAAQVPIAAARRTGSSDRLSMIRALTTGGSFDTIVGSFSFSFSGDPIDPNLYFYTLANGDFKYGGASHPSSIL